MAGNSPTSPLPGVTRGGAKAAPIGSLGSITIHSPLGSVTNGGAFASGHFKVTPHGQRRRWADMTPVEMWPATPSPGAGPETLHSFGVPAANATPTSPSTVPPQAFPAYTVTSQPQSQPQQAPPSHMTVHPAPAPVQAVPAAASIPAPFPGGVIPAGMPAVPMPGMPMPMPVQGGADGTQMVIMQVPAGAQQPQAFIQMPMAHQQPGAQVVFMAPPQAAQPAPEQPKGQTEAEGGGAQSVGPGFVSDNNALQHAAGRQLFTEAMDPATLDGANPNLASKGSTLHGTGRCSPCAWFWKSRGCNSGWDCTYCHMCPEGELKARKKAKVQAIRMGVLEPAGKAGASTQVHNRGALKLNSLI